MNRCKTAESDDANGGAGPSQPRHPSGESRQQQHCRDQERDGGQTYANIDRVQGGVLDHPCEPFGIAGEWRLDQLLDELECCTGDERSGGGDSANGKRRRREVADAYGWGGVSYDRCDRRWLLFRSRRCRHF